jgi:hypothetical protein
MDLDYAFMYDFSCVTETVIAEWLLIANGEAQFFVSHDAGGDFLPVHANLYLCRIHDVADITWLY